MLRDRDGRDDDIIENHEGTSQVVGRNHILATVEEGGMYGKLQVTILRKQTRTYHSVSVNNDKCESSKSRISDVNVEEHQKSYRPANQLVIAKDACRNFFRRHSKKHTKSDRTACPQHMHKRSNFDDGFYLMGKTRMCPM